jgi:hypothetical protein
MEKRTFEIDFSIDFGSSQIDRDPWIFSEDGTMTPSERERFLAQCADNGCSTEHIAETIKKYQKTAVEEIANILREEAKAQNKPKSIVETETDEEYFFRRDRARDLADTEEYLSRTRELKEHLHNRMNN